MERCAGASGTNEVSGSAGHVDRQWFPRYAGGGGTGGDPRARSHEWRTINLDNGVDMSIWRQFDRTDGNALQPFTGVTVSYPDPAMAPECAEDVEVTVSSYVRWPNSIRPLVRPLAPNRFMPDRHRLRMCRFATGSHRRAAGAGTGARPADRIHGRTVSLPRNAAGRTGQRLRILRALAGAVPGLGADRRAGRHRRGVEPRRPSPHVGGRGPSRRGTKVIGDHRAAG